MSGLRTKFASSRSSLLVAAALFFVPVRCAHAHEGPPFPILVDKPAAGHVVSIWADPDIGEATFYVILETPEGKRPTQEPDVLLWVQPVSKRLDRAEYRGKRQDVSGRMQFEISPEFDERDMWTVGVQIKTAGGATGELTTEVESTPPGLGVWDFAIYLFPFVLLGGFWLYGMIRRRRMMRSDVQEYDEIDGTDSNQHHAQRATSNGKASLVQ